MKILHILRNNTDREALEDIYSQARKSGDEHTLLLLHDAVLLREVLPEGLKVFACAGDVKARGMEVPYTLVDYSKIVELVFSADKVINW